MSVNISDVDEFTDPITAPDDGDAANGATFQAGIQKLANRTRNHKNRIDELYGGTVSLTEALIYEGFDVTIEEDLAVGGAIVATGNATAANLASNGTLTVAGASTLNGNVSIPAILFANRHRFLTRTGADANSDFSVSDGLGQIVFTPTAGSTRTYTILDTGASNGDWFYFCNFGASTVNVERFTGGSTVALATGESALFIRCSAEWIHFNKSTSLSAHA